MDKIILEKPDLKNVDGDRLLKSYIEDPSKYDNFIENVNETSYLYWDNMKYKAKPQDMSSEEFWYIVRLKRMIMASQTQLSSENGKPFMWVRQKSLDKALNKIDMYAGGQMFVSNDLLKEENKQKFLARGILEEAIASSQLEGASTTRKVAKTIILENREPRNNSERMIVNNFKTMKMLEEEYKNKELTIALLFEIHASITKDTIANDERDRLRRDSDDVVVRDDYHIAHIPPKQQFLDKEIEKLINYANDKDSEIFIHPVIKAIFLHFWIGYLHPFTDGNGRIARALFYWYLLRKGYWAFMYLPISSIIKNSPEQYRDAYLYTEQDENDLTYFSDYQIKKILQALEGFNKYIDKVNFENKEVDVRLGKEIILNNRQKQLIHYLLSESEFGYVTLSSHRSINNIAQNTAIRDLKDITKKGLLVPRREGKFIRYYLSESLKSS